jgi:cation diffusion facilitator CzcD-associated flavoprotein CzcO
MRIMRFGMLTLNRFARSPQWYHERPNRDITALEKFCFKYIPFWQRYHRYSIFSSSDALVTTYGTGEDSRIQRADVEKTAKHYIYSTAPKKYHDFLVPKFPLGMTKIFPLPLWTSSNESTGCKRRIFDPGYLQALHADNLSLVPEGISKIDASGIVSESGVREEFDVIVLATGFEVTGFLAPLKIVGKNGIDLHNQWDQKVGAQAYMGVHIHNFPNFALM